MTYIEDYLKEFSLGRIRPNQFDHQIASSLGSQVLTSNKGLTEKQGNLAIKLLNKYKNQFLIIGYNNILEDLKTPNFKYPFRVTESRKYSYIEDNSIVIKFPFDQTLVNSLREISNSSQFCKPTYDGETKSWKMMLNEESLMFAENLLLSKDFSLSDDILFFLDQMNTIRKNIENHVPMLIKSGNKYQIKNCLIEREFDDLLAALIESLKVGIYVHDDNVNDEIESLLPSQPLMKLFTINNLQKVLINNEDYSKEQLISLIKKFDSKVAIFFEEDVSVQSLKDWHHSLISCGVNNSEISVYYRKSGIENEFNQTIKDLELNKDADDPNVKWFFLSSKYPKSLFKNDKIADICVFVDRHVTTHYTTINVMNNSLMNIRYSDKKVASLENSYNMKRGEKIVIL